MPDAAAEGHQAGDVILGSVPTFSGCGAQPSSRPTSERLRRAVLVATDVGAAAAFRAQHVAGARCELARGIRGGNINREQLVRGARFRLPLGPLGSAGRGYARGSCVSIVTMPDAGLLFDRCTIENPPGSSAAASRTYGPVVVAVASAISRRISGITGA